MLKKSISTVALMSLIAVLAGCEQSMSQLGGKNSPDLGLGESHFFKVVSNANQADIQMSQIALQRSHDSNVRQFAQQMLDQHNRAQSDLQNLANSKNVQLPRVLGNIDSGVVTELSSKNDADFDKTYIQSVVAAHQDEVNNIHGEATDGSDIDVKAYAQQLLPTVQQQLNAAKQLQGTN